MLDALRHAPLPAGQRSRFGLGRPDVSLKLGLLDLELSRTLRRLEPDIFTPISGTRPTGSIITLRCPVWRRGLLGRHALSLFRQGAPTCLRPFFAFGGTFFLRQTHPVRLDLDSHLLQRCARCDWSPKSSRANLSNAEKTWPLLLSPRFENLRVRRGPKAP